MQIKFQDYIKAAEEFKKTIETNCKAYAEYLQIMTDISEHAMMSGQAAETLKFVLTQLERAQHIPQSLPKELTNQVNQFLADLHQAQIVDGDSILYDEKYEGYRDYSDHMFACLKGSVEATDYNEGIKALWDYLEDSIVFWVAKITGHCDLKSGENLHQAQKDLLDYKDVTLQRLLDIRNNIHGIFAQYTANFLKIAETTKTLNDYLDAMAEIFDGYSKTGIGVTDEQKFSISQLYETMVQNLQEVQVSDRASIHEIEKFLEDGANLNGPWRFHTRNIIDYLIKRPAWPTSDAIKIAFFQMFNLPEWLIKGKYNWDPSSPVFYDLLINTPDYIEKTLIKNNLLEMLEEICDSFDYDDSVVNQSMEGIEQIFNCIKQYGDNWIEKYPGDRRRKEFRHAKDFFNQFDDLEDILTEVDGAAEILMTLFSQYSQNLDLLDSLERNYESNESMQAALKEIRALYEKKVSFILDQVTYEKLVEEGLDYLYNISIGNLYSVIEDSIEVIGEVTEENERTLALLELDVIGEEMLNMAESAFATAVQKLKNAEEGDPLYTQYVDDVQDTFLVYKATLKRLYEKMAAVAEGEERNYYYQCAKQVENMRITDTDFSELLTFEEYQKKPVQVYGTT